MCRRNRKIRKVNNMRIFITGATGFLGYHITNLCVAARHKVLCLKRTTSVSLFEPIVEKEIEWVNSDEEGWEQTVLDFQPDVLIHCAWGGVSAEGRNNPIVQHQNVVLSEKLFKLCPYRQIIVLGSQEEYGRIDSVINEDYRLNPVTEYAKAKIETCKILQDYANTMSIEWQWIRVFTVYGEKQKESWLIPSMVQKCLNPEIKVMETTKGEQTYSYMYSTDFAKAITSVVGVDGKSGIYNISSSTPTMLKDLFSIIKEKLHSNIEFAPVLPYREYQSMMIMGDSSKFKAAFGDYEQTSLSQGLDNIIRTII